MAVRFDASGDLLSLTTTLTGVGSGGAFTTCGWFKRKVDTGAFASGLYLARSASWEVWAPETEAGGDVWHAFELISGGSEIDLTGPTATTDTWIFLALVRASNTSRTLYWGTEAGGTLNSAASATSQSITTDANRLYLGNDIYSENFNGEIAYVRLWSVALSSGEIDAEWRSATPVKTSNLYGDWRLAAAASATTDSSGGSHTLTSGGTLADGGANPTPPAAGKSYAQRRPVHRFIRRP